MQILRIQSTPAVSFWDETHPTRVLQAAAALRALIPREGECEFPRSTNMHLDKFRRAVNCYYDLYNNGLCNRKAAFARLFKVDMNDLYHGGKTRQMEVLIDVEDIMLRLCRAAAKEQKVPFVDDRAFEKQAEWEACVREEGLTTEGFGHGSLVAHDSNGDVVGKWFSQHDVQNGMYAYGYLKLR